MRMLAGISIGTLAGLWLAAAGARLPGAWMMGIVALGAGVLVAFGARGHDARPSRVAALLFSVAAAIAGQAAMPAWGAGGTAPAGVARIEGRVESVRHTFAPIGTIVITEGTRLEDGASLAAGTRLALTGLDAPPDSAVRLLARVRPETRFHNPSPHPAWPSRPLAGRGRVVGPVAIHTAAGWPSRLRHHLASRLRVSLESTLSPPTAALARALLLGEAGALAPEDRDAVRSSGLAHVLAVSGLHVALLAGLVVAIFRRVAARIPALTARADAARVAALVGVPFALAYAGLVGDAPSAWRAALTASIAWTLLALGRRPSAWSVTALAVLVLALSRPEDVPRPGFLLSVVATASLVAGSERAETWLRGALDVGSRTTLATAPILVWCFGELPLIGILANVVAVPVASICVVPLAALHGLTAPLGLGAITAPPLELSSRAFLAICHVFGEVPLGRELPPPDLAQGLIAAAGALGVLALRRGRARLLVAILAALGLLTAEVALRHREQPRDELRATFLDVGQGDGALIDLPDGRLLVVDAGGAIHGGPDPGAHALVPLLRARRRSRIDVLVITHPHPDHYGGVPALLEAFEVEEIWDSGQAEAECPECTAAQILADARAQGTRVRTAPELCAGPRRLGGVRVDVLWPCPGYDAGFDPNDNSLVLLVEYGDHRLLLTGDLEGHGEAALLTAGALPEVDVLKVGHHGSRTSTSLAWLERLRPRVAVVSAGRENSFGHPHPEVWSSLLERVRCPIRTDVHGGVVLRSDGVHLEIAGTLGTPTGCESPSRPGAP